MRRTIPVLLATAGFLITASACGTAPAPSTPGAAGAPGAASAPPEAATCEALSQAYGKNMAPLAQALTEVVADQKAVPRAQEAMETFAVAVDNATKASEVAELREGGKEAADQLRAKSADKKFFATIKSPEDVDKTIGPTLTEWLKPISQHCS